jgi:hypothetical protein
MSKERDLRSAVIPLLSHSALGLLLITLVADVVASDARFNDWMAVDGKQTLSDDEMLETIDIYEDARVRSLDAVARFHASADLTELETALRQVLEALVRCRNK